MNTEITDVENVRGWICFDAECRFCIRLVLRFGPFLRRHRFELVPLQTPWVRDRLAKSSCELLSEMRLLTPQGAIYGGADALIEVAKSIWWARPLSWASQFPGVKFGLRKGYSWIARRRHCLGGACQVDSTVGNEQVRKWLPALGSFAGYELRSGGRRQPVSRRRRSKRVFFEMP